MILNTFFKSILHLFVCKSFLMSKKQMSALLNRLAGYVKGTVKTAVPAYFLSVEKSSTACVYRMQTQFPQRVSYFQT